jgi:tetratricopeptide (TPR) repeat protein
MVELRLAQFADEARRAEHVTNARTFAGDALRHDSGQALALVVLGTAQFYYDWDFKAAESSYRAALEIEPSNGDAKQYLSGLLAATNRVPEAVSVAQETARLEPLVALRARNLAVMYAYARDYEHAIEQEENALRLSPGYAPALFGLGRIHAARGRYDQAADYIERALTSGHNVSWLAELACVYAAAGRRADYRRVQQELTERAARGEHAPLDHLAHVAATERRIDDGFRALEQAVAKREPNVLWMQVDERLDAYRSDARYIQLLKHAGLQ